MGAAAGAHHERVTLPNSCAGACNALPMTCTGSGSAASRETRHSRQRNAVQMAAAWPPVQLRKR